MNVCVIGGGAAGLIAAINAASLGNKVRILELRDRVGKKILATGNGKCNMTNADMSLSHYHGLMSEEASRTLVKSVFDMFSPDDTIRFFEELGVPVMFKNGYAYPRSEQAASVLEVLRLKLESLSVDVCCDCKVKSIEKKDSKFIIYTSVNTYSADRVILACGSGASLKENDEAGYHLAKNLGHTIIKPLPSLVPILCENKIFKSLSGIRTKGSIEVYDDNNNFLASDQGELQLTSYGVSGIPAFMVSHVVAKHIENGSKLHLLLDFFPELSKDELLELLKKRVADCSYKMAETFLIGLLNKNLSLAIIKDCGIDYKLNVTMLSNKMLENIVDHIKSFKAEIAGTKSYQDAQICAGGVSVDEIKTNLESKLVSGLYFAGEMIDVHGDCGGYNLQWAFSSGSVCGKQ